MFCIKRCLLWTIAITLVFSVTISGQTASSASSNDETAIQSVTTRLFTAYQKKDINTIELLWSAKSPDFASSKQLLEKLFAENENILVKDTSFRKTEIQGEKAKVRAVVEITAVESKSNKPSRAFGSDNRFINLVKEGSNWKIFREISAEKELASRLVEAKSMEERDRILKDEKELINIQLAIAVREEGNRRLGGRALSQVVEIYKLSLSIAEQIGSKQHISYALNGIGNALKDMGKMPEALEAFQKALKINEDNQDKDAIIMVLNNIGILYSRQNDYEKALDYFQRSYKIAEEVGNKMAMANSLGTSGGIFLQQSDYAKSLEYLQNAIRLREEIGDQRGIASNSSNIGVIYAYQNDYDKALEYWEKSVKIMETKGNSGDNQNLSVDLMNIGNVYDLKGNTAKAMLFYQRSLKISEEIGFSYTIGSVSVNIGSIYYNQGNYEQAILNYNKALKIAESSGDKYNIITALSGISNVFHEQGDLQKALEYSKRSLSIAEEIGHKSEIAKGLLRTGQIYRSLKDSKQALDYFQKALKQSEAIGENERAYFASIEIAKMQISDGNFAEALKTAGRAKTFYEKITGLKESPEYYTTIAEAYRGLNQVDKARESLDKAIAIVESQRSNAVGGEEEQERFFANKISAYHLIIDLLTAQNNSAEAFAYAERAKARALLDILQNGKRDITKVMTVQEREQEQFLKKKLVSLNAEISKENQQQQPDKNRLTDLQTQLEKKRLEFEDFQTRLYAVHPELKVHRGEIKPVSLAETDKLIADNQTALLEFVVTEDKTFLFLLNKAANQSSVSLKVYPIEIKQKDLAERVESFRSKLGKGDLDFPKQAQDLYNLLLKPAAAQLQGKTNLIIAPDGELWNLPFQSLQSAPNRYLIEQSAVSYAPSLTALREMTRNKKAKSNQAGSTELLAFGNPIVGKDIKERVKQVFMSESLDSLPEAEKLVNGLGKLYGANRSKVFTGAEATENKAKAESSKYRILQFATHGILNDSSPMYSHLVLAQKTSADANEDGLLEAWEMKDLNLNADMVVLSACETARGRVSSGEGVIGMSWALFIAGVPTTVVSQWKVESASTTELMLEFHRQLLTGKNISKAEALRRASIKLLKSPQYKHPSYWAGFVMVGDGF